MIKIHGNKKSKNLIIGWGSTKGAILDAIDGEDYKFLQVLYMKPLSNQMLSNLLWAAWGINRSEDGRRTAPSSHNEQNTVLYCSLAEGLYTYDAQNHSLVLVTNKDIRAETGTQDYVKNASLNLMYVAKGDSAANWDETRINAACVNAAFIAQNVYLFCASEGLSCVVRGSFDGKKLQEILQLGMDKVSVLAQSVGFPAEEDK